MTDQELIIKIKADTDKATSEINRLNKEIGRLTKETKKSSTSSKAMEKSFASINTSAGKLVKTLGGIVAAYASIEGAKSIVRTSAEIEEGFIGIAKTTGLAGKAMDELKGKIYDMSTSMAGVKLDGLQKIAETAGQLGIQGTENILEFTRVITMMASTTELSAGEAADAMAQLGNALSIPVKDYERLGSSINELSNTTSASAKNVVEYGQRIAGVGKTFGLTSDEVLGFAATLKDLGISAELGGTAVSKMMMLMLKNTKGFAEVANMDLKSFSDTVKNEPVEAIKLFLDGLGELDRSARVKALDDLKLSSSGAAQTMLKLSGNVGKLTENLQTSQQAWQKNTSLQNEYKTASEGFNAQMDRVGNSLKVIAGKIGEELLPRLKEMVEQFVKWVDSLDDETIKKYADEIANLAEAIGNIAGEVGKFTVSAARFVADNGKMIVSVYLLVKALRIAKGSMFLFGTRAAAMAAPAGTFGAAMATMTTSLGSLWSGLTSVIAAAGPWGAAIAGIIAATTGAVALADNYAASLKQQAEADVQSANAMDAHTAKIESIGAAYQRADAEVEKHGSVTKATRDQIASALKTEIAAVEKQLSVWEKNASMTKTQEKNFLALAKTLGTLKAKLDTLDADYSLNMELETENAYKEMDKLKSAAEEPVTSKLGFDPNTQAADAARKRVGEPIVVPVIYSPGPKPSGGYAGGGPVPQRLASGGTFVGSGRVPGYDPTDSDGVNAKLTGGEFVIKRKAVDAIGVDALMKLNNIVPSSVAKPIVMPNRYADGGVVSVPSSSASPDMAPINLNIGGQSFGLMGDREVAEALQRYIESEGGL